MDEFEPTTWSTIKDHFNRHKVSYAMGAFIIWLMYNNVKRNGQFESFLTDKGIDPMEFFLAGEDYIDYLSSQSVQLVQ